MEGMRFLLVTPTAENGIPNGPAIVATDATAQADVGQEIYYVASREAAVAMDPWFVPVDHAIVGIVDQLDHPSRQR